MNVEKLLLIILFIAVSYYPICAIVGFISFIKRNKAKSEDKDLRQEGSDKEMKDDLISRQAVLNQIFYSTDNSGDVVLGSVLKRRIENLPPVNPQKPKTGHWEWVQYDYNPKLGNWHCSECRCIVVECVDKEEKGGIPLYKYCPQCGTKMIEPQESEDKDADKKCTYKETGCGSCKRQLDCPIEADMAESEPQERSDKE